MRLGGLWLNVFVGSWPSCNGLGWYFKNDDLSIDMSQIKLGWFDRSEVKTVVFFNPQIPNQQIKNDEVLINALDNGNYVKLIDALKESIHSLKTEQYKEMNKARNQRSFKLRKNQLESLGFPPALSLAAASKYAWARSLDPAVNWMIKEMNKNIDDDEKKADHDDTSDELCYICFHELSNDENTTLVVCTLCQLVLHTKCFELLISNKSACISRGKPITLNDLSCIICRWPMQCNSVYFYQLSKINKFYKKVETVALQQLKLDGRDNDDVINDEACEYYLKPKEYAMDIYSIFVCYRCEEPYYAGLNECYNESYDNVRPEERVCLSCLPKIVTGEEFKSIIYAMVGHGVWLCPNNHVYFIGNKGTATNGRGRCLECDEAVGNKAGAKSHTHAEGNKLIGRIERAEYTNAQFVIDPNKYRGYTKNTNLQTAQIPSKYSKTMIVNNVIVFYDYITVCKLLNHSNNCNIFIFLL
eukprot:167759_1